MKPPRGQPKPPSDQLDPTKIKLTPLPGARWYRCADKSRPRVDWDNRANSRFSHPDLPFPVLYLAPGKETAFWECFGDHLMDLYEEDRALYKREVEPRQWVELTLPDLKVFDSTDPDSLRSAHTDISAFLAHYEITQAWAKFLMSTKAQGILYRSRLDSNQKCMAVFATDDLKKAGAIPAKAAGDLISDTTFLRWLLREQKVDVV